MYVIKKRFFKRNPHKTRKNNKTNQTNQTNQTQTLPKNEVIV